MLKILVADKSEFFREGVIQVLKKLQSDADIKAIGLQELIIQAPKKVLEFDILVLTAVASEDFADFVSGLTSRQPRLKVIVISEQIYFSDAKFWFSKGVSGYLDRDVDPGGMLEAIYTVLENKHYIEASMLIRFVTMQARLESDVSVSALSQRESQVMEYLLFGFNTLEISEKLKVRTRTVVNYRSRIFQKLDVSSLEELARIYRNEEHWKHVIRIAAEKP